MAGRGPAPKDPAQRRRRNVPEGGEWVYLPPLERSVLPNASRGWSDRVKRLWKAWRQDPVTQQYGPADLAAVWDLADQYESLKESEQRLRMESLGLTPKGRQDRRWRPMTEVPPAGQQQPDHSDGADAGEMQSAGRPRLRVVAPEAEVAS